MSSTIPALPARINLPAVAPPKAAAKPPVTNAKIPEKKASDTPPRPAEHHAAPTLSPSDIGYADSLLGIAPAQTMEYIMLKTGVPMPANLGQDVDTTA